MEELIAPRGFLRGNSVPLGIDFNNITESGYYTFYRSGNVFNPQDKNTPPDPFVGYLLVFNVGDMHIFQATLDFLSQKRYTRYKPNNRTEWSKWKLAPL